MTKARKGETVQAEFRQGPYAWFYLQVDGVRRETIKMCSGLVRQFVELNRARAFDVVLSTTKPRGADFYHTLKWDSTYNSWRLQGVTGYAPPFLGGINNFISRRFLKSSTVYIVVYA